MTEPGAADAGAASVRAAQDWLRDWMFGCALPFWRDAGHEGPEGGASEALALDGGHGGAAFKRMRVQARQLYVFSHAALLGWPDGARLARETYGFMRRGERAEGGWVRRLSPDGRRVLDPAIDLYDQAFVLLALAWFARLEGAEPLVRAQRTVGWLRAHMAHAGGGYRNVVPDEAGPRQQNPHMHLLEAALALHATTGQAGDAELAHELVRLFRARLWDGATGVLGEQFTDDWAPVEAAAVEPGHHFEWVWLLDGYGRAFGADMADTMAGLYRFATAHGVAAGSGLVLDGVSRAGRVVRGSARLWPQTEALKAHAVMLRRGAETGAAIAAVVGNLRERYLCGCPPGAWIDQLDAQQRPISTAIPTSSFYHLMTAYAELQECRGRMSSAGEWGQAPR